MRLRNREVVRFNLAHMYRPPRGEGYSPSSRERKVTLTDPHVPAGPTLASFRPTSARLSLDSVALYAVTSRRFP